MRIAHLTLVAALLSAGCVSSVREGTGPESAEAVIARRSLAMAVIDGWHETSALAARRLIQEYGVPDEVHRGSLTWRDARPWSRVEVREMTPPYAEDEELGVLAETIDYPLSQAQARLVQSFDRNLSYDPVRQELSARSDREPVNILRLNLADEIVGRGLEPELARAEFARALALERAGKTSASMRNLRFLPVRVNRP